MCLPGPHVGRRGSNAMTNPDGTTEATAEPKPEVSDDGSKTDEGAKKSPDQDSTKSESEDMSIGSPAKIPALAPAASVAVETSTEGGDGAVASAKAEENLVEFKVVFNKKKYEICFDINKDVAALKAHLQPIIEIPPAMMKVMIKGLAKDKDTLAKLGVNKTSKVMVIGSSLSDVLQVSTVPPKSDLKKKEEDESKEAKESSESQKTKQHKKVLEKGKPEDAMPGVRGRQEPLPSTPISGMLNKLGAKVRLTFKHDVEQVWIGTKDRTQKLPLNSIRQVVSEPIEGHPEYHIVALQLGSTEASRYWIYWVPAQFVESIKDVVLGKWSYH